MIGQIRLLTCGNEAAYNRCMNDLFAPTIPALEPHCGSWIIVSRSTGEAVLETFSAKFAKAINQRNYEVLTALQWLTRFNERIKQS